ncbi:acyl-CoA dehydrogenase family protein [Bacillus dakarensis]|uniref:acyl-CoA dehydrogenase family protein n=1 Tax=Robertmurraya dakarensis TaxID=1926278 RepID=UPI0009FCA136|nr:acyl-CoA dehydrogenase family protein [Bacillus dakarensis]
MIDYRVPNEVKEVIASLDRFIEVEVAPLEKEFAKAIEDERFLYDENGYYTKEIQDALRQVRVKSAQAGFFTMFGTPELGGMGDQFGPVAAALIHEELMKKYGFNLFIQEIFPPGLFTGGLSPVLLGLTPKLREEILPKVRSGESLLCFGLSEPDAGSDVWSMKTRAIKDGEHWIINGTKQWITNSPYADYAIVFAITEPELVAKRKGGITAFLVPFDQKTCINTSVIPYLGSVGSNIGIISLEDARVHEANIIGKLNDGFGAALHGVDIGRVVQAAYCVGIAQWALDRAIEYAKQRKTFGVTIDNHQAIQMLLAECAMDIYAGRNMMIHCAWKMENQKDIPLKEISIIKAFNTEMAFRVVDRCMQIMGGMGLTNEMKLEKAWRWARARRVPDGTAEIQRRTIARRLLKGDLNFN